MLYDAYEVQRSFLAGASRLAGLGAGWLNNPANPLSYSSMSPLVAAGLDVFAHASAPRGKPKFGISSTLIGRKRVPVRLIAERHIVEDLGWLPSPADYLREMPTQPWMRGRQTTTVPLTTLNLTGASK